MSDLSLRRFTLHQCAIAIAIAIALTPACALHAQEKADGVPVAIPATYRFDIPAQPLSDALQAYARASRQQVTFNPAAMTGKTSRALDGVHSVEGALRILLEGSGMNFRRGRHGVWLVGEQATSSDDASPASEALEMERVQVTGSRLRRTATEGPVAVNVYTRDAIARSGQTTLVDFLNTLPEVSVGTPENGQVYAGQTTVRLRGMPLGATLVLVNGRRVQSSGGTPYFGGYFDLNNIPAAVIERVEVVPEGSSAVYGSDALAGVVNVILKSDFEGIELSARHGMASGLHESGLDVTWGKVWDRGAISLVASHFRRSSLEGTERAASASPAQGLLDDRCNPGNVYSVDGQNLPGLDAPYAGVAAGLHESPARSDFNAGQLNLCRLYGTKDLIPEATRSTLFLTGSYRLNDKVELFSEVLATRQEQRVHLGGRRLTNAILPASNAFNPFGVDVRVNYGFTSPLAQTGNDNRVDFFRVLAGARGHFSDRWDWEVAAWEATDDMSTDTLSHRVDSQNLLAALASSDRATALNVFTAAAPASDAVLRSIYGSELVETSGRSRAANGFVRGALFDLPAGSVDAVIGAEHVESEVEWSSAAIASYNFSHARKASSLFSEVRIPLIAGYREASAGDTLAVTAALRHDRYDDSGSSTTPQYAIEWRPSGSWLFRGSYAESFKAPSLIYLHAPTILTPGACCVADPRNGGEMASFAFARRGNPDLDPESGSSRSFGAVWSPEAIPGFEASLSRWKIRQTDRATSLAAQVIVDNESMFPGRVVRNPGTGRIEEVSVGFLNYGELEVSGWDLGLSYRLQTDSGVFLPRLSATRIDRYDASMLPGAQATDRLGRANADAWAPRLKTTAGLAWLKDAYSASLTARYVSDYIDYQDLGPTTARLGDFWLFDLSARYELGQSLGRSNSFLGGLYLQLNIVNALNALPEKNSAFSYGSVGYDPMQYDIRGRFVTLAFGSRF